MGLTIEDLRPKPFTIKVRGVELACKPLRLSHSLVVSRIGSVLQNPNEISKQQIKQAEADLDEVIAELVPELAGIELDTASVIDIISQLLETVVPSENEELQKAGVKMQSDPKGVRTT